MWERESLSSTLGLKSNCKSGGAPVDKQLSARSTGWITAPACRNHSMHMILRLGHNGEVILEALQPQVKDEEYFGRILGCNLKQLPLHLQPGKGQRPNGTVCESHQLP